MGARGQWGHEEREDYPHGGSHKGNLNLASALTGAARNQRHQAPQAQIGPRQADSSVVRTNPFSYMRYLDRVPALLGREEAKVNHSI
jgi:hypothetical protein